MNALHASAPVAAAAPTFARRPAAIIPAGGPPDAAALSDPAVAKAWKSAKDFEAMALGQLLAPIFDTVDSAHGPAGGGDGEAAWRPMLTQEMAKHIAGHGGLGLAVPVFNQILRMQEAGSATSIGSTP